VPNAYINWLSILLGMHDGADDFPFKNQNLLFAPSPDLAD
jgi:hypothetical protein